MRVAIGMVMVALLGATASADDLPEVRLAPDESALAVGGQRCAADLLEPGGCEGVADDQIADYAPLALTRLKRGRAGEVKVVADPEYHLVLLTIRETVLWSIKTDAKAVAVAVTPSQNVVIVLDDGTAFLRRNERWVSGWRVLVSDDETQVAVEHKPRARICRSERDCDKYDVVPVDSGTDEDKVRYHAALDAGGFRPVWVHLVEGKTGKLGRLRVKMRHGKLTVRRRGKVIASAKVADAEELGGLAGLALTPSGNLVVVFRYRGAMQIALPQVDHSR